MFEKAFDADERSSPNCSMKDYFKLSSLIVFSIFLSGCSSSETSSENIQTVPLARISGVSAVGESGIYNFQVTVESPDTGCDQYADWWDVFSPDGTLLYRRILTHSHVDEQPFTRTGGPVNIDSDEEIVVRAHMNNLGFGTQVFRGSVDSGFQQDSLEMDFAIDLETAEPLPINCAF